MNNMVSVIIPTFNQEKYLREAIQSACKQSYRNTEIIVINDGSTDGTEKIVMGLKEEFAGLQYYAQPNAGLAAARNKGIEVSQGHYLAFLDSDDRWEEDKLMKLVDYLNAYPEVGLAHHWAQTINEHSVPLETVYRGKSGFLYDSLVTFDGLNIPPPSFIMIRRAVIDSVGWFHAGFGGLEDQEFYIRVAKCFKVGMVNQILGYYRIHSENMHKNTLSTEKGFIRLQAIIQGNRDLPKRIRRKSKSKVYLLLMMIRMNSHRNTLKMLLYFLKSFFAHPVFCIRHLLKSGKAS